jgi:hypothetical protein
MLAPVTDAMNFFPCLMPVHSMTAWKDISLDNKLKDQ